MNKTNKNKFEMPKMEIVEFSSNDVIVTSNFGTKNAWDYEENYEDL